MRASPTPTIPVQSFTAKMELSIAERAEIPAEIAAAAPASGESPPPLPNGIVLPRNAVQRQPGPNGVEKLAPTTAFVDPLPRGIRSAGGW